MLSCREASRLASQAQDRRLRIGERLGLRWHYLICRGCRAFAWQLRQISQACRQGKHSAGDALDAGALPAMAKARIQREIWDKQGAQRP
jgi:hypothetical protein